MTSLGPEMGYTPRCNGKGTLWLLNITMENGPFTMGLHWYIPCKSVMLYIVILSYIVLTPILQGYGLWISSSDSQHWIKHSNIVKYTYIYIYNLYIYIYYIYIHTTYIILYICIIHRFPLYPYNFHDLPIRPNPFVRTGQGSSAASSAWARPSAGPSRRRNRRGRWRWNCYEGRCGGRCSWRRNGGALRSTLVVAAFNVGFKP